MAQQATTTSQTDNADYFSGYTQSNSGINVSPDGQNSKPVSKHQTYSKVAKTLENGRKILHVVSEALPIEAQKVFDAMPKYDQEVHKEQIKKFIEKPLISQYAGWIYVPIKPKEARWDSHTINCLKKIDPLFESLEAYNTAPAGRFLKTPKAAEIIEKFKEGVEITHPAKVDGKPLPKFRLFFNNPTNDIPLQRSQECRISFTGIPPPSQANDDYAKELGTSILMDQEKWNSIVSFEWPKNAGLFTGALVITYKFFPSKFQQYLSAHHTWPKTISLDGVSTGIKWTLLSTEKCTYCKFRGHNLSQCGIQNFKNIPKQRSTNASFRAQPPAPTVSPSPQPSPSVVIPQFDTNTPSDSSDEEENDVSMAVEDGVSPQQVVSEKEKDQSKFTKILSKKQKRAARNKLGESPPKNTAAKRIREDTPGENSPEKKTPKTDSNNTSLKRNNIDIENLKKKPSIHSLNKCLDSFKSAEDFLFNTNFTGVTDRNTLVNFLFKNKDNPVVWPPLINLLEDQWVKNGFK